MNCSEERQLILISGASLLATRPYETITTRDIGIVSGLSDTKIIDLFESMHGIGSAILTHEGASMRAAQRRAAKECSDPLKRIPLAFHLVGENLAADVIVRAGIRIAGESHHCFPERKINPFRTWRKFVTATLSDAIKCGSLDKNTDIDSTAWLITAAGLGTKDLLMFTEAWEEAPFLLEKCARLALGAVAMQPNEIGKK